MKLNKQTHEDIALTFRQSNSPATSLLLSTKLYMRSLLHTLFDPNSPHFHWLQTTAVIIVAFFAPIHQLLGLTLVLVVSDMVLGVYAAVKRGETISSKKLRRTLSKILGYEVGIILGFIIESKFGFGIPLVKIVASVIGLTETKSIAENLSTITGADFLKIITDKLQGLTQNAADKVDDEDKK